MIIILSPKGTPREDILFAIDESSTTRIKMRYVDVEKQIQEITNEVDNLNIRIDKLQLIQKEMDKLLK